LYDPVAALAEVLPQRLLDAGIDLFVRHLAFPRVGRQLEEGPQQDDALHAHLQVGHRRDFASDLDHVDVEESDLLLADALLVLGWNALPDVRRVGVWRLEEDRAAGYQALERLSAEDGGRIVDADEIDMLQLAVDVDMRVGNGQVVGGRQALLLRAVLRIRLHVLAEDVAGNGGDDLVRRHGAEAADRVAAHREAAAGTEVRILGHFQRQGMVDADAEEVLAVLDHVGEG